MKKIRKIIFVVLGSVLGLIVAAILLVTMYLATGVDFPSLKGAYQPGKIFYEVVDSSRQEIFSNKPNDKRDLVLTIYYPARPAAGVKPSPRVQGKLAEVMAQQAGVPRFMLDSFQAQCYDEAPLAGDNAPYPVLLFSQGFAGQLPWYSSLLEEVVSHGYIVVCISHPYTDAYVVYPDGRVVYMNKAGGEDLQYADRHPSLYPDRKTYSNEVEKILNVWTDDTIFVLDRLEEINTTNKILAKSMNLDAIGIFGHSFGGSATLGAMLRDNRIKAGLNMEGAILGAAVTQGVQQPFLMMETPTYAPRDFLLAGNLQKVLEKSERCFLMAIQGAGHVSFVTDVPFMAKKFGPLVHQDVGTIDPDRSYEIITSCTIQFFDRELKGINSPLLDKKNISVFSKMQQYPEVTVQEYARQ